MEREALVSASINGVPVQGEQPSVDPVALLQGIWDVDECDGDANFNDSFKGSWEFSGNTIRLIEAQWSNATCSGDRKTPTKRS